MSLSEFKLSTIFCLSTKSYESNGSLNRVGFVSRNLFPIKYNILAKCNKSKDVDVYSMKFDYIN